MARDIFDEVSPNSGAVDIFDEIAPSAGARDIFDDIEPEAPGTLTEADMARITGEFQNRERLQQGHRQMTAGDKNLVSAVATSLAPKPPTPQEIKEAEFAQRAGAEPIPLGTRLAAGAHTGLQQAAMWPRIFNALLVSGLDTVGLGDTKLAQQNRAVLAGYAGKEADMARRDQATFGNDIPNELAAGTARALAELPFYLGPGMVAKTPQAAITTASGMAGLMGGGTQLSQDLGEGMGTDEALPYAVASGLITALTTRAFGATGAESIFRQEGARGLRNRMVQVLKDAGLEGAEEAADEFQQDFLERWQRDPDKPVEATIKQVLMAGAIGGIVGGSVSGTRNTIGGMRDFAADQARVEAGSRAAFAEARGETSNLEPADQGAKLDLDYINRQLEQEFDARAENQPAGDIFDQVASETQPQNPQTELAQPSRQPAAVATPAPVDASPEQQARVRAELEQLPGDATAEGRQPVISNQAGEVGQDSDSIDENSLQGIYQATKKKFEAVKSAVQKLFPGVPVKRAPDNVDIRISADGATLEVSHTLLDDIQKMYPGKENEVLTLAVEEEKIHHGHFRQLGSAFKEKLSHVWQSAPKEIRDLVRTIYGAANITADEWGAELLRMATQAVQHGRTTEHLHPRRGGAAKSGVASLQAWAQQQTGEVGAAINGRQESQSTTDAPPAAESDLSRVQRADDDNAPATWGQIKALAEFIEKGGPNPFAAAPKVESAGTKVEGREPDFVPADEQRQKIAQELAAFDAPKTKKPKAKPAEDVFELPTQEKPLDVEAEMRAIHAQRRNEAEREAREKRYEAETRKEQEQGITDADGLLFTLAGQGIRLPYFAPPGLVMANYTRLKNKLRRNGILSSNEKQLWNQVRERIPDNFEDNFGVDGEVLKQAYAAAKEAGLASALFERVSDGRNLRYDTILDAVGGKVASVKDLLEQVAGLAQGHAKRKTNALAGYAGMTDAEIAAVQRGEQIEVEKARVIDEFETREPEASPSVEQQQRLVDDLAARNPGIPELQGLRVVGGRNARTSFQLRPGQSAGDRGQSGLPSAGARDLAQLLERLYGVRIIPVDSAGDVPFNGVKLKNSKVVLLHAGASKPMLTVAGHELWHHLRETHPGLAREFIEAVTPLLRDIPKYQRRLERMGVGQVDPSGRVTASEAQAIDEILGDFMGDSLSEPKFLQGLAEQEPNLFKRFARIAVQWLDKLIAKLRNAASGVRTFGSSEFITDLETAQRELKMLLVEAARETQYQARGLGTSNNQQPTSNEEGAEFSKRDEGGDMFGFDAAESVAEQRERIKNEELKIKNAKAKEQMRERAAARLVATDDTRTQEMFNTPEGRETRTDKAGQGALFSKDEPGPLWRSNIQDALQSWQNKGTPQQLMAHLQKTRGAMDEAEWIGLAEWLKDKASVTKQEVADFVAKNTVDVQEVTKGDNVENAFRLETILRQKLERDGFRDADAAIIVRGQAMNDFPDEYLPRMRPDTKSAARKFFESKVSGTTKFQNYQLPGGENYRELLLTLPVAQGTKPAHRTEYASLILKPKYGTDYLAKIDNWTALERAEYFALPGGSMRAGGTFVDRPGNTFQSSHFDEANIVAHVRFNERTDAEGKRVLHLEEVQSDWHQRGRKDGYQGHKQPQPLPETKSDLIGLGWEMKQNDAGGFQWFDNRSQFVAGSGDAQAATRVAIESARSRVEVANDNLRRGVPNAPFKQTWPMLAMKRMIRYAADNGFDRITWTTGEQQAERYDLSKQVDDIRYVEKTDGTFWWSASKGGLMNVAGQDNVPRSELAGQVGKEIADRMVAGAGEEIGRSGKRILKGENLKVGGEGMKGFYDRILPSEVNKFVKKWGGRVGKTTVPARDARSKFASWSDERLRMELEAVGEDRPMSREQRINLLSEASNELSAAQVHSLDITPGMKDAAQQGMPLFSKDDPAAAGQESEFARLQGEIVAAELALKAAIRQHMNPPEGMTKAQALAAKDTAAQRLHKLFAEQLKMMTDPRNVDIARSPEETANLISETVDLLNTIQDDISQRAARGQEIPPDVARLRTDLQERLRMLKGWSEDQSDEVRGARVERQPVRDDRFLELESAAAPEQNTLPVWRQKLALALRYFTSPIPELPLTGPRAAASAPFRRWYRLLEVENNRVRKEAAEKINHVVAPLVDLGRQPVDNVPLRRYYKLHNQLKRAEMNEPRKKAIKAEMRKLEETHLNKDPFNLFRRLVLYKDLAWRATYLKNDAGKPLTLPLGLTVEEVQAELGRTYQAIEKHPDGLAITEALRRHYRLTDELQQSIVDHGEIIPESLKNPLYYPHHVIDNWTGRLDRVRASTEEDFRFYLITPTGSERLIQSDYLQAMYLHTADVMAHNARVDLVKKYVQAYDISEQLKAQHGENWPKTWNLPPGIKLYAPYKKLPLRMDYILSREVLADKLGVLFNDGDLRARMGEAGKVIKVKPEDLHAAMVAGEKIQWAMPEEIVDALEGIEKREKAASNPGLGHTLGTPFRALNTFWKKTKLFAPWNWVRYEYGNLSTDAIDKVVAADPAGAKYFPRAAREVWESSEPGAQLSPEFKAAAREGVFDTITAAEAGLLTRQPEFKAFLTPGEARWNKVRTFLERPMQGSRFRESVFRYAKFLADVERLRRGEHPVYAGAFHRDIEALSEDVDGQRRMLEGEELIYAQAAEISLKTYGDYAQLGVVGQWLRTYAVPFWSWQDVNFRYHANQLRNLADGLLGKAGPDITSARKAALRYAGVRVVSTLVAIGLAKELWNQFGGPMLGLWDDDDELEENLSAEDRRRGHILLGKDKDGKTMVVYTPSAWSDVAEWIGGQNMKRLFMEWARGQITLDQWITDYAKELPGETLNKAAQSVGPLFKAPYELASGRATFPDVLDQRSIPAADKWWRLVGTLTDDRAVNTLRAVFDQDYYSVPAQQQLQQIILQIRRRDPLQWSYFEAREDAAEWKEKKTGKRFEQGSYNAPEAQALRNFRKAIYRGDVDAAERFYTRLLEFGYTAERLDASIRNQDPLSDLNAAERAEYVKSLTPRQQQELELANQYYNRIKSLDRRERQLFPSKRQPNQPANPALLRQIVESQSRNR
jgi:hypothetical protein